MLNDASGFQKIYLATGYTDLRRGMEGLANIIRFRFHLDPYDRNTLFLFCGKRTYRIKGLLLGGRWFPVIVQTVRYRCFQLVKEQRRSTGNYSGTVRDAHAGTGGCCQTPDRADRGSEETLLSFVHFSRNFLWTVLSRWTCSPLFIHNDSVLSPMRLGRQGNCGQQY